MPRRHFPDPHLTRPVTRREPRHPEPDHSGWFAAWFVFCAILALAVLGCAGWAVITLVQWLVSR